MPHQTSYEKMELACDTAILHPEELYRSACVNYKGTIPKECDLRRHLYYTEYIAQFVYAQDILRGIKENIEPEAEYKIHSHEKEYSEITSHFRQEENIAFNLFNKQHGEFIDYQYPVFLQSKKNNSQYDESLNGQGKVDLIYKRNGFVYLVELKNDTSEETLLRCVLEISTYYNLINKARFSKIYGCSKDAIKKAVMIFEGTQPYLELVELKAGKRPHLKQLVDDITFFVVTSDCRLRSCPKDANYTVRLEKV